MRPSHGGWRARACLPSFSTEKICRIAPAGEFRAGMGAGQGRRRTALCALDDWRRPSVADISGAELLETSGIDVGLRQSGGFTFALSDAEMAVWTEEVQSVAAALGEDAPEHVVLGR